MGQRLGTPISGNLINCTGYNVTVGGISGLGTGVATFLATPSSANLRAALTDEVGTGAAYFVGGALGTPASGTLTNCTGLPTTGLTTITSGTPPAAGQIGEIISNTVLTSAPAALTTGVDNVWNTISLTAGIWLVGGNVGVYMSAGTMTHMHADHNASGSTTIQTSPGGGSTTALHVTTNQFNGWIFPLGLRPYNLSGTTTIRAVVLADFSGGTAGAYGVLFGLRIA